ncbi:MAG: hypothetical protein OHK0029_04320 [Armatimonadaceae bacterium]
MQPPSDEPVYVISVAARLAGLPSWVLRVLDQEGIVVPARTESNRRLYSDQDIAVLQRVQYLMEKRQVNLKGVQVILEMEREQQAREAQLRATQHAAPRTEVSDSANIPRRNAASSDPVVRNGQHRTEIAANGKVRTRSAMPEAVEELALALPEVTDIVSAEKTDEDS